MNRPKNNHRGEGDYILADHTFVRVGPLNDKGAIISVIDANGMNRPGNRVPVDLVERMLAGARGPLKGPSFR